MFDPAYIAVAIRHSNYVHRVTSEVGVSFLSPIFLVVQIQLVQFQKLINVGPAFNSRLYKYDLLYILDSNLPAKKLLLGIQYSTFIELFTKTHDCVRPCKTQESAIVIFCKTLFTLFSLSLCKKILNFGLLHLNLHNQYLMTAVFFILVFKFFSIIRLIQRHCTLFVYA